MIRRQIPWSRQPQTPVGVENKYATALAFNPAFGSTHTLAATTKTPSSKGIAQNFTGTSSNVNMGKTVARNIFYLSPGWGMWWVYPTSVAVNTGLGARFNATNGGWDIWYNGAGQIQLRIDCAGSNGVTTSTAGAMVANTWNLVIVRYNGLWNTNYHAEIWVNGINVTASSTAGTTSHAEDQSDDLFLGNTAAAWAYASVTGDVPLFALGRKWLSDGEIKELSANPWQIFAPLQRTFAVGAAEAGVTAAITGQGLAVAQGTLPAQVQSSLSGQALNLAQGTVVVEAGVTTALTGQAIQIAQGSIVAGVSTALNGQTVTTALGSVTAAMQATITGQAVTAALGDVWLAGDIVRAITGQSVTTYLGTVSVLAASNTFSQEVAFRKFYMRKGKKLLMFDSISEAEAYTQAETLADEAIAKANKTSRLARKRLRNRIVADALPAQIIDTDWLAEMMQRFAMNLDLPALLAERDYDRVMEIHALAMKMQDEDDIELLLMMG